MPRYARDVERYRWAVCPGPLAAFLTVANHSRAAIRWVFVGPPEAIKPMALHQTCREGAGYAFYVAGLVGDGGRRPYRWTKTLTPARAVVLVLSEGQ